MAGPSDLNRIEIHCREILNSPYLRKEAPPELAKLRAVLEKVEALIHDDIPGLISEVKDLRRQNKQLDTELRAMRATTK